jgi:hypothetical protein
MPLVVPGFQQRPDNLAVDPTSPRFRGRPKNPTVLGASLISSIAPLVYASKSVINRGRVFMKWSALTFSRDLQVFINNMRSALLDIESVGIDIPPTYNHLLCHTWEAHEG